VAWTRIREIGEQPRTPEQIIAVAKAIDDYNALLIVAVDEERRLKDPPTYSDAMSIVKDAGKLIFAMDGVAFARSIYALGPEVKHGMDALEIGGPSLLFSKLYAGFRTVDGVNHPQTVWQGAVEPGAGRYTTPGTRSPGHQYVTEAGTSPSSLALDFLDKKYDVVLASHVLEHIANPLKALRHWRAALRPGGRLLLVLPDRRHCFDHRRPVTPASVLLRKYKEDVTEGDLSSLDEILELHDLSMDRPAGTPEQFRARSLRNAENRCLHHHVFDAALLGFCCENLGMVRELSAAVALDQVELWRLPG
jgi:SAM-dependent methyltransferase